MGENGLGEELTRRLASLPEAIVITDLELEPPGPRILWVNVAFENLTNYHLRELVGRSPRILQGRLTDRRSLERLRRVLASDAIFFDVLTNYRRCGDAFYMALVAQSLKAPFGRPFGFISICREIRVPVRAGFRPCFDLELLERAQDILAELQGSLSCDDDLAGIASRAPRGGGNLTPEVNALLRQRLTTRQVEVAHSLLRGEDVRQIAEALRLSLATVRNHRTGIYRRLGIHSQRELMRRLLR